MIYLKTYMTPNGLMVAACDCDLLGKKLREGEMRLHVTEHFYKGDRVGVNMLIPHLKSCLTANLVGETVVDCALQAGLIEPAGVIRINGVPHAQLYRM